VTHFGTMKTALSAALQPVAQSSVNGRPILSTAYYI